MNIGIIGSGDVGRALGHGFVSSGYKVMIGTRDAAQEKLQTWQSEHAEHGAVGSPTDAAIFGDMIVLATHWEKGATENAITIAGKQNFAGKILIDVTNPLDFSKGVPPALTIGHTDSGGEQVQRWLPDARVVKAFNTVGNANMYKPSFPDGTPDMFICGNDADAKQQVEKILLDFGWPAIDLGDITMSRYLEPLAMVWIMYGFKSGTWNHAFKLLQKH